MSGEASQGRLQGDFGHQEEEAGKVNETKENQQSNRNNNNNYNNNKKIKMKPIQIFTIQSTVLLIYKII